MGARSISAILWTLVCVNSITLVVGGLITWLGYTVPARLKQLGLLPELVIIAGFASLIVACIGLCALNYSSHHALNIYGVSCSIFVLMLLFGIPQAWYRSNHYSQGNLVMNILYFSLLTILLVLLVFAFIFAGHLRRKEQESDSDPLQMSDNSPPTNSSRFRFSWTTASDGGGGGGDGGGLGGPADRSSGCTCGQFNYCNGTDQPLELRPTSGSNCGPSLRYSSRASNQLELMASSQEAEDVLDSAPALGYNSLSGLKQIKKKCSSSSFFKTPPNDGDHQQQQHHHHQSRHHGRRQQQQQPHRHHHRHLHHHQLQGEQHYQQNSLCLELAYQRSHSKSPAVQSLRSLQNECQSNYIAELEVPDCNPQTGLLSSSWDHHPSRVSLSRCPLTHKAFYTTDHHQQQQQKLHGQSSVDSENDMNSRQAIPLLPPSTSFQPMDPTAVAATTTSDAVTTTSTN